MREYSLRHEAQPVSCPEHGLANFRGRIVTQYYCWLLFTYCYKETWNKSVRIYCIHYFKYNMKVYLRVSLLSVCSSLCLFAFLSDISHPTKQSNNLIHHTHVLFQMHWKISTSTIYASLDIEYFTKGVRHCDLQASQSLSLTIR